MIFKFEINKRYLLAHTLKFHPPNLPFPEWTNLQNYLWKLSPQVYRFLAGEPELHALAYKDKDFQIIVEKTQILLNKITQRKEFKRLYKETEEYKRWLEKEWGRNESKILGWIHEITRLDLPHKKITVYVTHPKLYNGKALWEKEKICWGHPEKWKNYSIIYLAHELMHIIIKDKGDQNIMHTLIQLTTDNEIRTRLNKKAKYFKQGKFNIGHPHLLPLEKKILPSWRKYLVDKKQNLLEFGEKIKKS